MVGTKAMPDCVAPQVKDIVARISGREPNQISDSGLLFETYDMDSLMVIELMAALDNEFGIDIPEEELSVVKSVNDVIETVTRHVSTGGRIDTVAL